jgi:AcrR family transcriptional regulator
MRQPSAHSRVTDTPTIREQILDRTIYLMGKLGTTDVPVRTIAREAGVNVAAVNYYFSSKEEMLAQAADRFLRGCKEVMKILQTPGLGPEERLRRWAAEVMHFLTEYPGVLVLMERQMAAEAADPFGTALRQAMRLALRQLKATLREVVGGKDEQRHTFKLTLLVSALAGPFPRYLDRGAERRAFGSEDKRERFLDLLLDHLRK